LTGREESVSDSSSLRSPDRPRASNIGVTWIHGSPSPRHRTNPPIQVHRYDERTFIMRQTKDLSFEAPFLYLMFGSDRALLLDTGATEDPRLFPLRSTVDRLVDGWTAEHPKPDYELIVAHTHGHRDHAAGDGQFLGRPLTRLVPRDLDSVRSFFKISRWPEEAGSCYLGGRTLDIIPAPGHHPTSVAVYDPWTKLLITGDTLYPGRLYVSDFPAFVASLNRLVSFAAERPVSHIMGCHIEMTRTPRKDYPATTKYQPDEPPLQMTVGQLVSARDAAVSVQGRPGRHVFDDFSIFNGPCYGAVLIQLARAFLGNLRYEIG
jgi:hydroxyacylglutathione hydrolase